MIKKAVDIIITVMYYHKCNKYKKGCIINISRMEDKSLMTAPVGGVSECFKGVYNETMGLQSLRLCVYWR